MNRENKYRRSSPLSGMFAIQQINVRPVKHSGLKIPLLENFLTLVFLRMVTTLMSPTGLGERPTRAQSLIMEKLVERSGAMSPSTEAQSRSANLIHCPQSWGNYFEGNKSFDRILLQDVRTHHLSVGP